MFHVRVTVTLRSSILDPQGKAVEHGVHTLGYGSVHRLRIGKHVEFDVDVADRAEAEKIATDVCSKLLANPVMEDFVFTVTPADGGAAS